MIAVWAYNHRWGEAEKLSTVKVNNSQAYIEALAGVLSKANSSQFLVEVIGKEEQRQLQKTLGLGDSLLDHQTLIKAWVQQTQGKPEQLRSLLRVSARKHKISETDLLAWLKGWEKIRGLK